MAPASRLRQAGHRGGRAAARHTASSKGQICSEAEEVGATSREGDTQKPVAAKVKRQMDPTLIPLSAQVPREGCERPCCLRKQVVLWPAPERAPLPLRGAEHRPDDSGSSALCRIRPFDRSGVFSLTFLQVCLALAHNAKVNK